MSDITEKILDTIKSKQIKPKPHWQFLLRSWLIFTFGLFSVIIGSLAFSLIVFKIVNNDWEVISYLNRTPFHHLFKTLPYVWIIILILFVGLAYYNARHTKGAYKYNTYWLVIGSITLSMIIGSIFYAFGMAPRLQFVAQSLPIFRQLMHDRDVIWMESDNGLLAGEIVKILDGGEMFEFKDLNDNIWVVKPSDDYISTPNHFIIEKGVIIRMIGEKVDEKLFEAIKIMPYEKGPGIMKRRFH